MSDSDDRDSAIQSNMTGPQRVTGDAGSVSQHSIADQIRADQYLSAKEARKAGNLGIRFRKIKPPGAQ